MPYPAIIGCGASVGLIVAGFFLAGGHHEVAWRLKQRRYGGFIR